MDEPFRVLVPDPKPGDGPAAFAALDRGGRLVFDLHDGVRPEALPDATLAACDAFVTFRLPAIGAALMDRMPGCRILVRVGIGFDNVDLDAAAACGLPVCNVPDYGVNEVADHALALILAFTRGIVAYARRLQADPVANWGWQAGRFNRRNGGRRLGIVGLGRVGTALARRAQALGMVPVAYDPYITAGTELALQVERAPSLEALLGSCTIVSLHAPLTEETRGMIDSAAVAAMAEGTVLVNTARGALVDLDALHDGLKHGRIACAGLDVLPQEPPDPGHPLIAAHAAGADWLADRLILTPHAAFASPESIADMRVKAIETIADYLLEGRLRNCVNGAGDWPRRR